jgi:hypothetical protein
MKSILGGVKEPLFPGMTENLPELPGGMEKYRSTDLYICGPGSVRLLALPLLGTDDSVEVVVLIYRRCNLISDGLWERSV